MKGLKILIGLSCLAFPVFAVVIGITSGDLIGLLIENGIYNVLLVIFLLVGICVLHDANDERKRISTDFYNQIRDIRVLTELNNKYNDDEKELENSDHIVMYKELCKNYPGLYNNYAHTVLNQPLQLYTPVSSTTAAFIGTQIGGVAVGLAAAAEAERKMAAFKQNEKDVIEAKIAMGSAYDKVKYCYDEMIKIIMTNENTKSDWIKREKKIDDKLHEEYKIK